MSVNYRSLYDLGFHRKAFIYVLNDILVTVVCMISGGSLTISLMSHASFVRNCQSLQHCKRSDTG